MSTILIKPIITEKVTAESEKGRYGFIVARKANKIEIRKAVESHYNVKVKSVNTVVTGGGKEATKYTNKGVVKASRPVVKKAFVTLVEGDVIDLYGNI
ncbi:MAG: 50S ribosomal protein L23 [Flavobacteriales bacterium]|nr:50S ribosomal protein L23 [Flavobacteriales bacterium]